MFKEITFDVDDEIARMKDLCSSINDFLEGEMNSKNIMDAQFYLGTCFEILRWLNLSEEGRNRAVGYGEVLDIYQNQIVSQWKQLVS